MSGLDPSARIQLKRLMQEYKEGGNTIFFTSHILSDIEELCDRIAVMHDGVIIFTGTPQECVAQYKEKNLERAFLQAIIGAPVAA
jgi:ABC-2 type transport system ATP-binding protein